MHCWPTCASAAPARPIADRPLPGALLDLPNRRTSFRRRFERPALFLEPAFEFVAVLNALQIRGQAVGHLALLSLQALQCLRHGGFALLGAHRHAKRLRQFCLQLGQLVFEGRRPVP